MPEPSFRLRSAARWTGHLSISDARLRLPGRYGNRLDIWWRLRTIRQGPIKARANKRYQLLKAMAKDKEEEERREERREEGRRKRGEEEDEVVEEVVEKPRRNKVRVNLGPVVVFHPIKQKLRGNQRHGLGGFHGQGRCGSRDRQCALSRA